MGVAFRNLLLQSEYTKYAIYVTDLAALVSPWAGYERADETVSKSSGRIKLYVRNLGHLNNAASIAELIRVMLGSLAS